MYKKLLFFCLFISSTLMAEKPTICLNMIVKNERDVIARCLESVKPYIDFWVIVDTGSTDGTQDIIENTLKGVPGELYQSVWYNFGFNRNEALRYAKNKCDYNLYIDADEVLLVDEEASPFENLTKDYYFAHVLQRNTASRRIMLTNNQCKWFWRGIIHESLDSDNAHTFDILATAKISAETKDGCRSKDPNKALKDAAVLEKGLLKEPDNARYRFFLAQCYQNAEEYQKALENYALRAQMGGWDQELFYSVYQVGRMQQKLKYDENEVIKTFNLAAQLRPSRAEPFFELARIHLLRGETATAFVLARHGLNIPFSDDIIHVDEAIHKWGLKVLAAESSFKMGHIQEALDLANEVLAIVELPEDLKSAMPTFKAKCEETLAKNRIIEQNSVHTASR